MEEQLASETLCFIKHWMIDKERKKGRKKETEKERKKKRKQERKN